jgi:hypothetical protein
MTNDEEHALEFLLAFDGRVHWLEQGYSLKFAIRRVEPMQHRPHGLRYSFTLHDPDGNASSASITPILFPQRARGSRSDRRRPITGTARRLTKAALTHSSAPTGCSKISFGK